MRGAASAFTHYRAILARLHVRARPPLLLLGIGLLAALMDALAVSLILALLFSLLSHQPPSGRLAVLGDWARGSPLSLPALIFALVSAKAALGYLNSWLIVRNKNALTKQAIAAVHGALVHMPYAELRQRGAADLLNASATESWQVANAAYLVTRIAVSIATTCVFIAMVFWLSWRIALVAILGAFFVTLLGGAAGRLAKARSAAVRQSTEAIYTRLVAAVYSGRLLRAFDAEAREQARLQRETDALESRMNRLELTSAAIAPLNEVSLIAVLLGLVWMASIWGEPQAVALSVVALLYRASPHIRDIEANRLAFAALAPGLERVTELLAQSAPRRAGGDLHGMAEIRFEHVHFSPPGRPAPVMHDVSFSIPAGKVTLVTGPSGVGKTSIINLLLRLYEPDDGVILVGDTPLAAIDRSAWLRRVAVAGQDVEIVEGTVAENLRLGAPHASMDSLRQAASDAGILDFIESLPEGFESWVGSFGYNLSGGQRQRISLARAFLRAPDLLLLDETTNAVENALETRLLRNVRTRCPHATILIVSHRRNSALHADHLIELKADIPSALQSM